MYRAITRIVFFFAGCDISLSQRWDRTCFSQHFWRVMLFQAVIWVTADTRKNQHLAEWTTRLRRENLQETLGKHSFSASIKFGAWFSPCRLFVIWAPCPCVYWMVWLMDSCVAPFVNGLGHSPPRNLAADHTIQEVAIRGMVWESSPKKSPWSRYVHVVSRIRWSCKGVFKV